MFWRHFAAEYTTAVRFFILIRDRIQSQKIDVEFSTGSQPRVVLTRIVQKSPSKIDEQYSIVLTHFRNEHDSSTL